jgi:hypothetical protein
MRILFLSTILFYCVGLWAQEELPDGGNSFVSLDTIRHDLYDLQATDSIFTYLFCPYNDYYLIAYNDSIRMLDKVTGELINGIPYGQFTDEWRYKLGQFPMAHSAVTDRIAFWNKRDYVIILQLPSFEKVDSIYIYDVFPHYKDNDDVQGFGFEYSYDGTGLGCYITPPSAEDIRWATEFSIYDLEAKELLMNIEMEYSLWYGKVAISPNGDNLLGELRRYTDWKGTDFITETVYIKSREDVAYIIPDTMEGKGFMATDRSFPSINRLRGTFWIQPDNIGNRYFDWDNLEKFQNRDYYFDDPIYDKSWPVSWRNLGVINDFYTNDKMLIRTNDATPRKSGMERYIYIDRINNEEVFTYGKHIETLGNAIFADHYNGLLASLWHIKDNKGRYTHRTVTFFTLESLVDNFRTMSSVEEEKPENEEYDVKIFPNPSGDELNINSKIDSYMVDIIISDIRGVVYMQTYIPLSQGRGTVDISRLANGHYIITIGDKSINFVKE